MPLSVLLPLVIAGIAGVTLLLHFLGYSRAAVLADEAAARAADVLRGSARMEP